MINLQNIIHKYFRRNKRYIASKNVVHEMNGVVLVKSNNAIFDFHSLLIDEVINYCKQQGFNDIDRVIFLSSYDSDLVESQKINIKMLGESKIKIVKEDEKLIAVVCICEYVEVIELSQTKARGFSGT